MAKLEFAGVNIISVCYGFLVFINEIWLNSNLIKSLHGIKSIKKNVPSVEDLGFGHI